MMAMAVRPDLWADIRTTMFKRYLKSSSDAKLNTSPEEYFRAAYEPVMYSGAIGMYSGFVHRMMERRYRKLHTPLILELGAGAGQHFPYVQSYFEEYWETDRDLTLSPSLSRDSRVLRKQLDANDLADLPDSSVDRVIATCLLAHLDFPEQALRDWRRVVKPGGFLTIYVPMEPGLLLRLLRRVLVAPKSRRYGQDHVALVEKDHRNHYPKMRSLLHEVFGEDKVSRYRFPFPFLGWNFSLYEIFHIQKIQ